MVKSVPRQISVLSGDRSARVSEAKKQGRRLAYVCRDFLSFRSPCSGRTGPVPYLGPPIAPSSMA